MPSTLTRKLTDLPRDSLTRALTDAGGGGGGGSPGSIVFADALFIADPATLDAQGRWLVNPNTANAPTGNLLTYISGDIRSMAYTNITATRFANAGPGGANTAIRNQHTATGALFYLWQNSLPPAGQFTLKCKVKSYAGAGAQTLRYGNTAAYSTQAISEAGWTTLTYTFTATGLASSYNNFAITDNGTTLDYLLDEIQLYAGDGTSIPAWSAETYGGHAKRSPAWPGSLTVSGGVIPNPASSITVALEEFIAGKTFTDFTMIAAFNYTSGINNGCLFHTDRSAEASTISTTAGILTQTTVSSSANEVNTNPISSAAGFSKVKPLGAGMQIVVVRVANGARSTFFHEIECNADTTAFTGFLARTMRMGAYSATQLPSDTGSRFLGDFGCTAMWDRVLTDAEIYAAVGQARTIVTRNGASMGTFNNFYIPGGDSITSNNMAAPNGPGYFTLLTTAGEFTPSLNGRNFGVAGTTLAQARASLTTNAKVYQQAAMNGRNVICSLLTGTNDAAAVVADPMAYYDQIKAYWAEVRATGRKMVATTLLPKDYVGYNAARAIINAQIRLDTALYDALADVGGSPTVGADGAPAALVYYYDITHPNAAGHLEMLPIFKSAIAGVMI